MLFKLLNLNSNLALLVGDLNSETLGYLNPALNNSALTFNPLSSEITYKFSRLISTYFFQEQLREFGLR